MEEVAEMIHSCSNGSVMFKSVKEKDSSGPNPEATSPAPSCDSVTSGHTMDSPPGFQDGLHQNRVASPAPSYTSMKSDQSINRPIMFKGQNSITSCYQDRFASPSPSCISVKSDQSTGQPILLNLETEVTSNSLQDHLKCSVCMDVLKEPVSITCGHSFCKTCIHTYWSRPIHAGSYPCPQCKERFKTRPMLYPNLVLANVVQTLQQAGFGCALPARSYAEPGDVACDLCTEQKIRALKSCLTCCASYCESHVKHHYTVPALQRHTLSEVTRELKQRICQLHHRALEVFCKTDQALICLVCAIEEHKDHETVLTKSEYPAAEKTHHSAITESKTENMIEQLLNHTEKAKVQRAETALSDLAQQSFKGLGHRDDLTSDFVEVAALDRQLDRGMLYDCRSDFFSSGTPELETIQAIRSIDGLSRRCEETVNTSAYKDPLVGLNHLVSATGLLTPPGFDVVPSTSVACEPCGAKDSNGSRLPAFESCLTSTPGNSQQNRGIQNIEDDQVPHRKRVRPVPCVEFEPHLSRKRFRLEEGHKSDLNNDSLTIYEDDVRGGVYPDLDIAGWTEESLKTWKESSFSEKEDGTMAVVPNEVLTGKRDTDGDEIRSNQRHEHQDQVGRCRNSDSADELLPLTRQIYLNITKISIEQRRQAALNHRRDSIIQKLVEDVEALRKEQVKEVQAMSKDGV